MPGQIGHDDGVGGEQRIEAYVAAGHVIADHSFTHPHLNELSVADYMANVDQAEAWLKGREGRRPWFRYPFLDEGGADKAKVAAVRAALKARGLHNGYATVDGSDWNIEALTADAVKAGKTDRHGRAPRPLCLNHGRRGGFRRPALAQDLGPPAGAGHRAPRNRHRGAVHPRPRRRAAQGRLEDHYRRSRPMPTPSRSSRQTSPPPTGLLLELAAWEKGIPKPRWYERDDMELANRLFAERVLHEEVRAK